MLIHTSFSSVLTILLVSHAQDNLWGSVVSSHHIRGHHETGPCSPGQTEVQDLQSAVWLHHYIAWFEVLKRRGKTDMRNCVYLGNLQTFSPIDRFAVDSLYFLHSIWFMWALTLCMLPKPICLNKGKHDILYMWLRQYEKQEDGNQFATIGG